MTKVKRSFFFFFLLKGSFLDQPQAADTNDLLIRKQRNLSVETMFSALFSNIGVDLKKMTRSSLRPSLPLFPTEYENISNGSSADPHLVKSNGLPVIISDYLTSSRAFFLFRPRCELLVLFLNNSVWLKYNRLPHPRSANSNF